jgi:hypothetical protein
MATCRSHKGSTSHENAYIGPRHHCFSRLGKPLMSPPLPPGALAGVKVVLGAAGASCDAACEAAGSNAAAAGALACSGAHLHLLNSCDQLREVLNCEAGCMGEDVVTPAAAAAAGTTAANPGGGASLCPECAPGGGRGAWLARIATPRLSAASRAPTPRHRLHAGVRGPRGAQGQPASAVPRRQGACSSRRGSVRRSWCSGAAQLRRVCKLHAAAVPLRGQDWCRGRWQQ